ncbi:MAG: methyltransferase domain-containing protein [Verrucomicrobiota bacterium]
MTLAAASFRDPAGSCCQIGQRIIRTLHGTNATAFEAFLRTPQCREFVARGQLVATRRLPDTEIAQLAASFPDGSPMCHSEAGAVFEHERISFPSYPHEWPPEMLWQAGRLTLELARNALSAGYGLKDATPHNVLFRGPTPVFVDVASFELRDPGDSVWRPYGQFVRTFLLPLLVNQRWGLRLADIFTTHRDGLEPQEVYRLCGPLERFRPRLLSLVSMPTWLRGKARSQGEQLYRPRILANAEKARFIVESLLSQLQRTLDSLRPHRSKASLWSNYMETHSYTEHAFTAKEEFVSALLQEFKPKRVLDIGANTGHFSVQAATNGAEVVAIDLDPTCAGAIWQQASELKLPILPLVVDFSRPSPSLGWRNRECPSFLQRASGAFDAVLMLALVHHLLVTERIPLGEILELAAKLTTSLLIVEFIPPEDAMFRELARGRENLHLELNRKVFEQACARHFDILKSVPLPGTHRCLYGLKRKGGAS